MKLIEIAMNIGGVRVSIEATTAVTTAIIVLCVMIAFKLALSHKEQKGQEK